MKTFIMLIKYNPKVLIIEKTTHWSDWCLWKNRCSPHETSQVQGYKENNSQSPQYDQVSIIEALSYEVVSAILHHAKEEGNIAHLRILKEMSLDEFFHTHSEWQKHKED